MTLKIIYSLLIFVLFLNTNLLHSEQDPDENMTIHQQIAAASRARKEAEGRHEFGFTLKFGTLLSATPFVLFSAIKFILMVKNKKKPSWESFKDYTAAGLATAFASLIFSATWGTLVTMQSSTADAYFLQILAPASFIWGLSLIGKLTSKYS